MHIPQAIFTSLRGQRIAGYQLAAKSEEIGDALARELNTWGPAHDSLLDDVTDEPSVNFHPLGQEHFCLSLTSSAGAEYSGRAGARIYTQMFVLPREALARFDNNPFLILRAIEAAGRAAVHEDPPRRLRPIALVGRAGENDLGSGKPSFEHFTPSLSSLASTILDSSSVGLAAPLPPRLLFSALFHLLPWEERLTTSFTTGLRHSPRRPFRLFRLPSDPATLRQFQRQSGVTVVELNSSAAPERVSA
jgi:GTPase-associated protein 1, N-terminal domain type 2